MEIHLNNHHPTFRIYSHYLKIKVSKILNHLKLKKSVLSITFVDDKEIKKLNRIYRNKNKPTDVLSFTTDQTHDHLKKYLGDIIISLDTVKIQAQENKLSRRDECLRLIVHGILHLIGYDHEEWDDYLEMNSLEEKIWNAVM